MDCQLDVDNIGIICNNEDPADKIDEFVNAEMEKQTKSTTTDGELF